MRSFILSRWLRICDKAWKTKKGEPSVDPEVNRKRQSQKAHVWKCQYLVILRK